MYTCCCCWQESVGVLNSKLSLLEPSNLDQVDVRLASVLQKLNQIGEKKSGQADLDRQNKVESSKEERKFNIEYCKSLMWINYRTILL